jgi:hypothetical protein
MAAAHGAKAESDLWRYLQGRPSDEWHPLQVLLDAEDDELPVPPKRPDSSADVDAYSRGLANISYCMNRTAHVG